MDVRAACARIGFASNAAGSGGASAVSGTARPESGGGRKKGARISEIVRDSGTVVHAKMFIDAIFEGDLMAVAGVSSTVGREANSTYNETLNGVQVQNAVHHQFKVAVDPFVVPGDP